MELYNSLTRKKEEFRPLKGPRVGMYTCGPTVYDYVSIGNWRTYVLGDIVARVLEYLGYEVTYVMNITDVGHLTGDNIGDADQGEDRIEKGARREGKTAWEVAEFYTDDFLQGFKKLNLKEPERFTKATDHIQEQIDLIAAIEEKGFTYITSDGVYFDVQAYEAAGNVYGGLSTLDQIKEGARVRPNPEKKDPRDFALWKFSPLGSKRDMEWDSPWAPPGSAREIKGFPGWHIECSAMSMKYLGEQFDIHIGGEDLKSTHHPNEIAQSEAATGKKPFVKFWVHGAFLLVDGGRMGKSLGNAYTLDEVEKRGFDPLALRYFYLTAHYRSKLNFTWDALEAAQIGYQNLKLMISRVKSQVGAGEVTKEQDLSEEARTRKGTFVAAINDDLDMPGALAAVWGIMRSTKIPAGVKLYLITEFDEVLGLDLMSSNFQVLQFEELDTEVSDLLRQREFFRKEGHFEEADRIRESLRRKGYQIEDTPKGIRVIKKLKS